MKKKEDAVDRLKAFRKKIGLSQAEFAEELGITQQSYCMLENRQSKFSNRTMITICSVFELDENWLKYGKLSSSEDVRRIERLKKFRKENNLTQADFATSLGITQTSYNNIENFKQPLTEKSIKSICAIFKINEEWLRYGTGKISNIETKPAIYDTIDNLDAESKIIVEKVVKILSNKPKNCKIKLVLDLN